MKKGNINLAPRSSFSSLSEDIPEQPEKLVQCSPRIKRIRTIAMFLLFVAAVINFLDRSSLSVANLTIRQELGLNATEIGALLSVFSLSYGIGQLPSGVLLDRKGPRLILGLGMIVWSLFQSMSGLVHNFTQFVLVRIGMGLGEAPMNPCGVKVINDWFNIKERGRPMGFFNAASVLGIALSPPILAAMMLAIGWRGMFISIGTLGIFLAIAWFMLYRNREQITLTAVEQTYLNSGSVNTRRDPLNFAEWRSLFRNRTMWGMMLGFSGMNYAGWLYIAWLPGYLQTVYHLDLKSTGLMAAIPFMFGGTGMLLNGYATDWLVKRGMDPIKNRKICIVTGMFCSASFTLVVPQATTPMTAVLLIGMALFFLHFAGTSGWGLVHVAVASRMAATVGSIQNFASFICASFAPVVTGFIVDTTNSFRLALIICGCVTAAGALAYIFMVHQPISDPHKE
ncbi:MULTISPECIES: MFS transporter [unclassified Escherichia]|uniref:MFS transporter n=1 Tax=unclassified Escherichia TaxID=2608889 RepID=UPI00107F422D|nr:MULTISPECIES: MFS transporter [unclassified Escherichia]TGB63487.1 MFS transporter [Escherichia coli]TGB96318.1 MFS transporter [Escherichia sp. E2748]TGC13414.1 MFS transporter [Escherichia sp. E2562]TGC23506.1 MFS transporter [Escherichia sp. E1130]TLI74831.1 MFS transporter [Escherichia sp. E1130]